MRMKPPETKKKTFTREEFKKFLFDHVVIGDGDPIPFLTFYELIKSNPKLAIESISSMFPLEMEHWVQDILWEMESDG